jgi:hypothetical protein
MKRVFSFAIYGNVNKYIGGLLCNCKDINKLYPDFWIYIYIGNDFDRRIISEEFNKIRNLRFIETYKSGHVNMVYRFLPIDDLDVELSFSRDCDSRINKRDQYCISRFIASDKKFHIIRDNIQHNTKILGGMWGIKKGLLDKSIKELLSTYNGDKVGDDQIFLEKIKL